MSCYQHGNGVGFDGEDCERCKRNFDKSSSYCRCGQIVSNAAFFKRASPHFNGKCKPFGTNYWSLKVPERTVDKPPVKAKPYHPWPKSFSWPWKPWESDFKNVELPKGKGRWIRAMFAGKCTCGATVEKDKRGYYYRDSRTILCEDCGTRVAKARRAA